MIKFGYQAKSPPMGECCVCGGWVSMLVTYQWNGVFRDGEWQTESLQHVWHRWERKGVVADDSHNG